MKKSKIAAFTLGIILASAPFAKRISAQTNDRVDPGSWALRIMHAVDKGNVDPNERPRIYGAFTKFRSQLLPTDGKLALNSERLAVHQAIAEAVVQSFENATSPACADNILINFLHIIRLNHEDISAAVDGLNFIASWNHIRVQSAVDYLFFQSIADYPNRLHAVTETCHAGDFCAARVSAELLFWLRQHKIPGNQRRIGEKLDALLSTEKVSTLQKEFKQIIDGTPFVDSKRSRSSTPVAASKSD